MTGPPDTLVAELTYACPLRCGYCSNPVVAPRARLSTGAWIDVIDQAAALGVLQLHLTGGEPLLREDLEALVARGRARELYVNLITSGVPLERARLARLAAAGLDHLQLSFQHADEARNDALAGTRCWAHKREVAAWARALELPLTVNVVLHRGNIDDTAAMVALADELGADRIELANAQYLGSALVNRALLLPTHAQLERAREVAEAARRRRPERELLFVLPDYRAGRPRACMGGWARRYVVVAPDGAVLPCQAASAITTLRWERVTERPLAAIWEGSPALNAYRGEAWMKEPCRSCDRRAIDFGGCRCQAFALTGDAAATDPACARSPDHARVDVAPDDRREPARRRLSLLA